MLNNEECTLNGIGKCDIIRKCAKKGLTKPQNGDIIYKLSEIRWHGSLEITKSSKKFEIPLDKQEKM